MAKRTGGFIGQDGINAPDPATGVTGTAGDTQVDVSFTSPSDVGGAAITEYRVTDSTGAHGATGSSSPITVSGLTNDTSYTFNVWAINPFGWSSPSDASVSVTPELPQLAFSMGGFNDSVRQNIIEYVQISTLGNAIDFGDLTQSVDRCAGASSTTRGLRFGGYVSGSNNTIDYITMRSAGNAADYGDLTIARQETAALSNSTRWVATGSANAGMDYGTIATTGNASDFGDRPDANQGLAGCASTTRGLFGGGSGTTNRIDYITIASTGNSNDFGDLLASREDLAACSSNTNGFFIGGTSNSSIEKVTIASTGNSISWGSLGGNRERLSATSGTTRGIIFGGESGPIVNQILYFDLTTSGNSSDFGDLSTIRRFMATCSTAHGGLS